MRILTFLLAFCLFAGPAAAQMKIEVLHRRPLAEAARDGNIDVLKAQIAANVSPNQQDLEFRPAIVAAAANGHVEAVRILIAAKANIEGRDKGSRTGLMWASERGHVGVVRVLLDARADVNAEERSTRMTPLMLAAR